MQRPKEGTHMEDLTSQDAASPGGSREGREGRATENSAGLIPLLESLRLEYMMPV